MMVCPEFSIEMWNNILKLLPLPKYVKVSLYGFNHSNVLKVANDRIKDGTFDDLGYLKCRLNDFTVNTIIEIYQNQPKIWDDPVVNFGANIQIVEVSWDDMNLTSTQLIININEKEPVFIEELKVIFKDSDVPLTINYKRKQLGASN